MGIIIYDKNADFSATKVGDAGLYTSLTTNLDALFETRLNASKTANNSAPSNSAKALVPGPLTYAATGVSFNTPSAVVFPVGPNNAGANSFAMIIKIKNGGATTDYVLGSYSANPVTHGSIYITNWNRRVQLQTTLFDSQTSPATYTTNGTVYVDAPADGSLDGTHQLVVATVHSQDAVKLYWPKYGLVSSQTLTSSQFAYYNLAGAASNFKMAVTGTGLATQEVTMFAHWNSILSAGDVNTFYGEMVPQFERVGIII